MALYFSYSNFDVILSVLFINLFQWELLLQCFNMSEITGFVICGKISSIPPSGNTCFVNYSNSKQFFLGSVVSILVFLVPFGPIPFSTRVNDPEVKCFPFNETVQSGWQILTVPQNDLKQDGTFVNLRLKKS